MPYISKSMTVREAVEEIQHIDRLPTRAHALREFWKWALDDPLRRIWGTDFNKDPWKGSVRRAEFRKQWPEPAAAGREETSSVPSGAEALAAPPGLGKTPELVQRLADWIFGQHSDEQRQKPLYKRARCDSQIGEFRYADFVTAYQKVYETKRRRPRATGWPLREPYKERWEKSANVQGEV